MEKLEIYKPRHSRGGIYLFLVVLVFLLLDIFCFIGLMMEGLTLILLMVMILFFLLDVFLIILLSWFPTMVYKLSDKELILKCGRIKSIIQLDQIFKVEQKDLIWSAGFKFPGYALFRIRYAFEGRVRMYARSVCKDIVLIETLKKSTVSPRRIRKNLSLIWKAKRTLKRAFPSQFNG